MIASWVALNLPLVGSLASCAREDARNRSELETPTAAEARAMRALAAQIIPSDGDGAGAEEAGAVYFIDRALAQPYFAESVPLIREIEHQPFFAVARTLVVIGTFADPSHGGNRNHAGWALAKMDHQPTYTTYEELEPYYTKVDWEIGVSGAPGPFDPPRSKPYPLPPMPNKASGVLLEKGAKALGLHARVSPMAILSQPYDGRQSCQACGHCSFYGCEFGAKSSTRVAMIPKAVAPGRCEIRTESTATRVETNARGRASGVAYFDGEGKEHVQPARAVVLAANGAETARLLLLSKSARAGRCTASTQALAFRAADHITKFARANEI